VKRDDFVSKTEISFQAGLEAEIKTSCSVLLSIAQYWLKWNKL